MRSRSRLEQLALLVQLGEALVELLLDRRRSARFIRSSRAT